MSAIFLSPGQSQLLDHIMAWGNLRIGEITADPFASPTPLRSRESTESLMLPSLRATRYLDRVKAQETRLLTALGIDVEDMEMETSRPEGPTFNTYLWARSPAWLRPDLMDMAKIVMDDLSQIRMARVNVHERIMRWKRTFGAQETLAARPSGPGLKENLTWLQGTYSLRHSFANDLVRHSQHGLDLLQAFYDPAARTAQNILQGGLAVDHYLMKKAKPSGV
jgi:hypothetical protein